MLREVSVELNIEEPPEYSAELPEDEASASVMFPAVLVANLLIW